MRHRGIERSTRWRMFQSLTRKQIEASTGSYYIRAGYKHNLKSFFNRKRIKKLNKNVLLLLLVNCLNSTHWKPLYVITVNSVIFISKARLVLYSHPTKEFFSVNVIIWLMLSVSLSLKVITLRTHTVFNWIIDKFYLFQFLKKFFFTNFQFF